ncbi:hypothetical protein B0H16DRAFT_205571 [Mycena metata]|uniref:Uncharacterized protein n=1 Tax=Mycena metata TaxID=1033252 RepID=A0AAD7MUI3_9AGAR|nr:hypothetical protein B0H16DRAFT_205571 [Mycena metata]
MALLRQFLALACRLDFSFSSVWLSSKENAIADAASRFSFTRMFELAPYLDPQSSSKRLRIGGTNNFPRGPRPSHSTFGTDSRRTPVVHTQRDNDPSSISLKSTVCTTPTAQSSPRHNQQSWPGSPVSRAGYSQRPLSPTSPPFVPSTSTLTYLSMFASRQSYNVSSAGSNGFMVRRTANLCSPSLATSSSPSSRNYAQASSLATRPSTPRTASATPVFFVPVKSPSATAKTQASILPVTAYNFSLISTPARTSPLPSPLPRPIPFARESPSSWLPHLANHHARSPPLNASSPSFLALGLRPSSKALTANPSTTKPLLRACALPSPLPGSTPLVSLATVFVEAPPPKLPPPGTVTTRSSFSDAGAVTHTNSTLKTHFPESSIYPNNSTWLTHTPSLSSLRPFATTQCWLESDP